MRLAILTAFAMVGATIAAPAMMVKRQRGADGIIEYNTKRISTALKDLDSVLARKPRRSEPKAVVVTFFDKALAANRVILDEVTAAAKDIKALRSTVSPTEAATIMSGFRALNRIITDISDSWIAVKPDADYAGKTQEVRRAIQDVQDATYGFYEALNSKFPPVASRIGNQSKERIDVILNKTVRAYRGRNMFSVDFIFSG